MMFRDPPGGAPDAAALARSVAAAYQDVAAEVDVTLELASGQLPEALRGALYRNGPGAMGLGAERYHHPFDGDGMIACFEFDGGAVRYRNRFVATRERAEEQAAGRRLYRCFGTQLPGGWRRNAGRLRFKNSANTSVIKHAGSLWALWEGGWPHRLDPDTLDTLERNNLGGALCNDRSAIDAALNPELPFSAHPRLDARTGHLYNFGIAHGVTPRLMLYTLDAGGHVVERDAVALDAVSFVHDFGLTERWRVFLLPPVSFDLARTLAGVVSPASSLTLRAGEPMKILLVDRHDAAHHIRLDAPPGFVFWSTRGRTGAGMCSSTRSRWRRCRRPTSGAACLRGALRPMCRGPHSCATRSILRRAWCAARRWRAARWSCRPRTRTVSRTSARGSSTRPRSIRRRTRARWRAGTTCAPG
jgi:all-trans-8'-apo-beta-carotenal 15,15'-oxygenase